MPPIDDLNDALRALNIFVAAGLVLVALTEVRRLRSRSRAQILMRLSIAAFAVATAIASWEGLLDPSPFPGIRSATFSVALLWAVASLIYDRHDRH